MKVYILFFFPEDSRIRIVLRQAKSTCFVDSMYVGLGKERVLWAEAVGVPQGGWSVVGTSPCVNGLLICIATAHMCSHRYCR